MNPATSLLSLLVVADQVSKGLDKLASLRGAPDAVRALNNEVSELRFVLSEAEPLLQKYKASAVSSTAEDSPLLHSVELAKERLNDLETIIRNLLMKRMGTRDKLGWLYDQEKVHRALGVVRTAKGNITTVLGIITS